MKTPLFEEKGTAMMESIAVLASLPLILGTVLTATYVSFARFWIDRQSYETVVCLGSLGTAQECERRLRSALNGALPFGEFRKLRVSRNASQATVHVDFHLGKRKIADLTTSRRLPLTAEVSP